MTIDELKQRGLILFECISGSRAYGLATPESDKDIKGVFILPRNEFYGLDYVDQVSDATNDVVYYELRRFVELLSKSNPGALEMLYAPDDTILTEHPLFKLLRHGNWLSKKCKDTFGGYAMTQVRKAKGLNKKIVNPMAKERKSVLDFCFVAQGQGAVKVMDFLTEKGLKQTECGLSGISHMQDVYGLYHGEAFKGIIQKTTSNDIALSAIPKGLQPIGYMTFNKSGYSQYCKMYREYWDWVEKRNDVRYTNTVQHGKNYDAKNMMHTFRLLHMCEEIGRTGQLKVRRADRDDLLRIKRGEFLYETLLEDATRKIDRLDALYDQSELPEHPDSNLLEEILVHMRKQYYTNNE